ncbi:hypothetical protein AYL99_09984 [Fonsecaea erecta]|uniref:N-acetyltransferase domain-containing protein n=1 Tax=Fonsecaea erecta TaxID=1367422 RepID=A0A178Z7Z7_9EURO|nr:hypothetical protein AYL99_09984 [Fonsecaea erecta]OAP55832.1 hypothetical protein AYL99_09984 [Fonsecaea erecta]
MPLVLQPANEADAARAVEIEYLAYASNPLNPILFPGPFPPEAKNERAEGLIKQLHEDPTTRWMKVVDTETGEIAAFAKWNIIQEPREPARTRQFGPGCNVQACEEFFGGIHAKRNELMGGRRYCYGSKTPGTWCRRDADQMGPYIADELHLPAYLESSPAAHSLYQKFGFRDVDRLTLDPKWDYGSADASICFMLRDAK